MKPKKKASIDRVLEQIELSKNEAISNKTKMPPKRQICRLAGIYISYFNHAFDLNQKALTAYEIAKAEVNLALGVASKPMKRRPISPELLSTVKGLIGKEIGLWLVLEPHSNSEIRHGYCLCRCTGCNLEKPVYCHNLISGRSSGCQRCRQQHNSRGNVHSKVITAIATAKKEAIANQTYTLPTRRDLLKSMGANPTYFCFKNDRSKDARMQYEAAVLELADLAKAKPKPEPLKLVETPMKPTESDQSKPSKQTQLLAHLRLRKILVKDLPRLLAIEPREAAWLIGRLKREGLITIDHSPFAKSDKDDEIVLVKQDERKAG